MKTLAVRGVGWRGGGGVGGGGGGGGGGRKREMIDDDCEYVGIVSGPL